MAEASFEKSKVLAAAREKEAFAKRYLEAAKSGAMGFRASQEGSHELHIGEMLRELAGNIIVMIEHSDDCETVTVRSDRSAAARWCRLVSTKDSGHYGA